MFSLFCVAATSRWASCVDCWLEEAGADADAGSRAVAGDFGGEFTVLAPLVIAGVVAL